MLRLNRRVRPARLMRMQSLESRSVLNGDVSVDIYGGNLHIRGDGAANKIEITRTAANEYTITALDTTTTINGDDGPVVFSNVNRGIFAWLDDGADEISFTGDAADDPFRVFGTLFIDGGSGNDIISFTNTAVARDLIVLGGSGNDQILAPGDVLTDGDDTSGGGAGDDFGVRVTGVAVLLGLGGNDQIAIDESRFSSLLVIDSGTGDDRILLRDSDMQGHTVISGGLGFDRYSHTNNDFAHGPVRVLIERDGDTLAPTAVNDTATVAEGGTVSVPVSSNDFDPDGSINAGSITITQQPTNGTATVNSNGSISYTHNGSNTTTDTIKYTIKDASGKTSNVATVNVTVTPVNDAPTAVADTATVSEGGSQTINVSTNDTDSDGTIDPATIVITTNPTNGSVTVNSNGSVSYTHNGSETTTDSFQYTIKDNNGLASAPVTVSITVTPVNDNPTAVADTGTVSEGGTTTINAASNDSDPEGALDLTSIVITTNPTNGSATVNSNGTISYTHNGGETTSDTFQYRIEDTANNQSNIVTVTITVTPVNDNPTAVADTATVNEGASTTINVSSNDSDPEGALDLTSIVVTTNPTNGSVTVNSDGTVSYTHNGSETTTDSFQYRIEDTANNQSNIVTVSVTVTPQNDNPVAVGDTNSITEDSATVNGNVLANDTDPENNSLTVTSTGTVATTYGQITMNSDGSYVYTLDNGNATVDGLNAGDTLPDSFTYTISDGNGGTDTGTLVITINGVGP